jgi:hypothetical protein
MYLHLRVDRYNAGAAGYAPDLPQAGSDCQIDCCCVSLQFSPAPVPLFNRAGAVKGLNGGL